MESAPRRASMPPQRARCWRVLMAFMIVSGGCTGADELPLHTPWWMTDTVPALDSLGLVVADGAGTTVFRGAEPVCRSCDVGLVPLGRFGRMEDSILLRSIPTVERDAMGRFYAIAPGESRHELIVYDTDGSILRTIGQYGEGPGEFLIANAMRLIAGDTLLLRHDLRLSVFDSMGAVVRTVGLAPPPRAPNMTRIAGLVDGHVATSEIRSSDTLRHPLHLYDSTGRYIGPYGTPNFLNESYSEHGGSFGGRFRPVELLEDGSYFVLGPGYRVEKVAADGTVERVVGVEGSSELPLTLYMTVEDRRAEVRRALAVAATSSDPRPGTQRREPGPTVLGPPADRPEPAVYDLAHLGNDFVAVAIHVASEDFQDAPGVSGEVLPDGYHTRYDPGYRQQLRDTWIDVLDMASGVIMARTRVRSTAEFTSDGTVYATNVTDEGLVYFEAWEIDFTYDPGEVAAIRRAFGADTSEGAR